MWFWIWLSGYVVTFGMLFGMSIVVSKRAIEKVDAQRVLTDFEQHVRSSALFSLLSWFGLVFCIVVVIILKAGVNAEV